MINIKLYDFYLFYVICEPEACIPYLNLKFQIRNLYLN
jgi:hypothetical protein